jgi:hypothetical protein
MSKLRRQRRKLQVRMTSIMEKSMMMRMSMMMKRMRMCVLGRERRG